MKHSCLKCGKKLSKVNGCLANYFFCTNKNCSENLYIQKILYTFDSQQTIPQTDQAKVKPKTYKLTGKENFEIKCCPDGTIWKVDLAALRKKEVVKSNVMILEVPRKLIKKTKRGLL